MTKTSGLLALLMAGLLVIAAACGDDAATTTTAAPTTSTEPPPTTQPPVTTTTLPPPTTAVPPPTTTVPETTTTLPATTTTAAAGEADDVTAAAVRAAVADGAALSTGRFEGAFEISGLAGAPPGTDVAFTFSGVFDSTIPASSFVMDLSDLAAVAGDEIPPGFENLFGEMEMRQIGDTAYMRWPLLQQLLAVPTEWVSFPAESADPAEGLVGSTPGNPAETLGAFEAAGATVLDAGPDPIRGLDTNHYILVFDVDELVATADPEELAALEELGALGTEELALNVWIDPAGLLHRFEMSFDGSAFDAAAEEEFEQATMRFDILDHGAPVQVEAPPADQVTDGEGLGFLG